MESMTAEDRYRTTTRQAVENYKRNYIDNAQEKNQKDFY